MAGYTPAGKTNLQTPPADRRRRLRERPGTGWPARQPSRITTASTRPTPNCASTAPGNHTFEDWTGEHDAAENPCPHRPGGDLQGQPLLRLLNAADRQRDAAERPTRRGLHGRHRRRTDAHDHHRRWTRNPRSTDTARLRPERLGREDDAQRGSRRHGLLLAGEARRHRRLRARRRQVRFRHAAAVAHRAAPGTLRRGVRCRDTARTAGANAARNPNHLLPPGEDRRDRRHGPEHRTVFPADGDPQRRAHRARRLLPQGRPRRGVPRRTDRRPPRAHAGLGSAVHQLPRPAHPLRHAAGRPARRRAQRPHCQPLVGDARRRRVPRARARAAHPQRGGEEQVPRPPHASRPRGRLPSDPRARRRYAPRAEGRARRPRGRDTHPRTRPPSCTPGSRVRPTSGPTTTAPATCARVR